MVNVLTHYGGGIERAIKTPVKIEDPVTGQVFDTMGLWDTGATGSVITHKAAHELQLPVVSMMEVLGVHGKERVPVYNVVLTLNNEHISVPVRVVEGSATSFSREGDADVLIGMDIIAKGDLCISNYNGRTLMTFRKPSLTAVDYCAEAKECERCLKIHKFNIGRTLPDQCACGSGRLYKNCHGLSIYNNAPRE